MKCPICETTIQEGQKTCPVCGYTLPEITAKQPAAQPANPYFKPANSYAQPANTYAQPANTYAQPANSYAQPATPYAQPANPYTQSAVSYAPPVSVPAAAKPKKKKSPLVPILLVVFLLAVVGLGVYFGLARPNKLNVPGTYTFQGISPYDSDGYAYFSQVDLVFSSDGTGYLTDGSYNLSFYWEIQDGQVVVTENGYVDDDAVYFDYSFGTITFLDSGYTITYKK